MRRNLNRTAAAVLLGLSLASYSHYYDLKWSQRGREAFIVYQTQRFDKDIAAPKSAVDTILPHVLFAVAVFAVYELIAKWISGILKAMGANGGNS